MGFMPDTHYYEGKKTTFFKTGLRVSVLVFYPEGFVEQAVNKLTAFFDKNLKNNRGMP